jgi:L-alanine-DL-glutamate epimerase-like enolase superfamily enzyme
MVGYTSAGLGTSVLPVRLFWPGEARLFTLRTHCALVDSLRSGTQAADTEAQGELVLPTDPGWGTDVNEEAVRAHPPRR